MINYFNGFNTENDIMGLLSHMSNFSLVQRKIISYLIKKRESTKEKLLKAIGGGDQELKKSLELLVDNKILHCESFNNIELYSLDVLKKAVLYKETFPSGPIIPLVYQFNLLSDKKRLDQFTRAIRECVSQGDFVLDIGTGTGVLSIIASEKARHVYAIEVDPLVALHCKYFVNNSKFADKIKVLNQNVLDLDIPTRADLIICEMLDTALIAELQVPVMNYALKNLLKPGGKVIPHMAETSAQLIYKDFHFGHFEFKLPHFEAYGARKSKDTLSEPVVYHSILFNEINSVHIDTSFPIEATKYGITNGMRITTDTHLTESIVLNGSDWCNPPLILPFDEIKVATGDKITIKLKYKLGGGINSVEYSCKKEGPIYGREK